MTNYIPIDVIDYLRTIFEQCNAAVTRRLARVPNAPEESFDMVWIDSVGDYAVPARLPSGWLIKLETHFLGGRRHFESWEVADIGVLLLVKTPTGLLRKVALLQSKRLYPTQGNVRDETLGDYAVGMGRLADPEDERTSIGRVADISFSSASRYEALRRPSSQATALDNYEKAAGLTVYYQFYNPWLVPYTQQIPRTTVPNLTGSPDLGVRIVPAKEIHDVLDKGAAVSPALSVLDGFSRAPRFGWRLESFICDEFLACHEGNRVESLEDNRMRGLLYGRTGAIAASVAITIEAEDFAH